MAPARSVLDFPLWPEAPFREKINSRYEIRKGEFEGRELAVVWDPRNQTQASGYLNAEGTWSPADLANAMNNLAGATFLARHGFDRVTRVLAAKKIAVRVLSPEARELIRQYDELYNWEGEAPPGASPA